MNRRVLAGALVMAAPAVNDGHQLEIKRGACTIRITAVGPFHAGDTPAGAADPGTEQSHQDAQTVKDAIEKALEDSEDMQTKVDAACDNQGDKTIDVMVFNGSSQVNFGSANTGAGSMSIDLGDTPTLTGNADAVDTVSSSFLTRTLAHEFDHLRDKPGEDHEDPAGDAAGLKTGPAVDDENTVISQMDFPVHRRNFYAAFGDGFSVTSYGVDSDGDGNVDTTVGWKVEHRSTVRSAPGRDVIAPGQLQQVPTVWEPIGALDRDFDGYRDGVDGCVRVVNPQQGRDCAAAAIFADSSSALGEVAGAWVDVATGEAITHSDGEQSAIPEPAQEIAAVASFAIAADDAATQRLFGTTLPCGDSFPHTVFCASPEPPPAGPWIVVQFDLTAAFPLSDPERFYQYAVVFDADGDPSNNYEASAEFPGDFFGASDRWYELDHSPTTEWTFAVTDLNAEVPVSHARFVITGSEVALLVPAAEFPVADVSFRVTAFGHEGDFGTDGGPWSGDYHPRLEQPLFPVSTADPILVPG